MTNQNQANVQNNTNFLFSSNDFDNNLLWAKGVKKMQERLEECKRVEKKRDDDVVNFFVMIQL